MTLKNFYLYRAIGFSLIMVALFVVFIGSKISDSSLQDTYEGATSTVPYRTTLTGEFLCLTPSNDKDTTYTRETCVQGLKTADNKYYMIDAKVMSQLGPSLDVGDTFEANGLLTPIEMISSNQWEIYNLTGIFSITDSMRKTNSGPIPYVCIQDAKVCPDGTTVGRSGSDCRFMMCPFENATSGTIMVPMGGTQTTMNISVTPKELVSDSRCPSNVQCIWAGTVEVKTVIASKVAHGEHVLKLNTPQNFGNYTVTLIEVTPPAKTRETIPLSSYRFTYMIEKK